MEIIKSEYRATLSDNHLNRSFAKADYSPDQLANDTRNANIFHINKIICYLFHLYLDFRN